MYEIAEDWVNMQKAASWYFSHVREWMGEQSTLAGDAKKNEDVPGLRKTSRLRKTKTKTKHRTCRTHIWILTNDNGCEKLFIHGIYTGAKNSEHMLPFEWGPNFSVRYLHVIQLWDEGFSWNNRQLYSVKLMSPSRFFATLFRDCSPSDEIVSGFGCA